MRKVQFDRAQGTMQAIGRTSRLCLGLRACRAGGQLFPLASASGVAVLLRSEGAAALPDAACAAGASQSDVRSMWLSSAPPAAQLPPVSQVPTAGACSLFW